jgi:hypothetical protein
MTNGARLKLIAAATAAALLSACSSYEVHSNLPAGTIVRTTVASHVQVLYSEPKRPYQSIGIVSAVRYKPGWTDPSIADAVPELQAAGANLGADAVIIRGERSLNDRHITVEAEAIRYTDQ